LAAVKGAKLPRLELGMKICCGGKRSSLFRPRSVAFVWSEGLRHFANFDASKKKLESAFPRWSSACEKNKHKKLQRRRQNRRQKMNKTLS